MNSDIAKYIVSLDQGTTSCRALLIDVNGDILGSSQKEFSQIYPEEGWVEHDPEEIWETQRFVLHDLLEKQGVSPAEVLSIGITNQRETTVVWNRETGKPIYNAIVWQDKRTADYCEKIKDAGLEEYIKQETGLVVDSYFCATKIQWILDHVEGARQLAHSEKLCFGTIDSWLIWKLTNGDIHATDFTNASRTMLYNIKTLGWDDKLLDSLEIPKSLLPAVNPSSHHFGDFKLDGVAIPINGVAGDQQAALFGQACFEPGMAKNTYGTGCFLLMNIGEEFVSSQAGLLTTLACSLSDRPVYAFEGSIFIAGAAIQWLRDGLKIIKDAKDTAAIAESSDSEDEVYVVPAFAGLGAPYWDMYARGAIFGLTRKTDDASIVKATLQSMGYQTKDVILAMIQDAGLDISELNVDGGAAANDYLMQFQADVLGKSVTRPQTVESTAMGVAYLAGIKSGIWSLDQIKEFRKIEKSFHAQASSERMSILYAGWKKAVARVMNWNKSE
ncbi:MAG: glycerol kinase GlpK [Cyclobacteriaceae bacterium]